MSMNFPLRNTVLLAALAAAYPLAGHGAAAVGIDFATGGVTAVNAAGVQRPVTRGAEIGNGDTVRTGDNGRAQLRFSDGALVSLQPGSEFRVDEYRYSGQPDGREKSFVSLLKGAMRTITGLVGRTNRDAYRVNTQVATIGIRGTEFVVAYGADNQGVSVTTGEGQVEVCNPAGCALVAAGDTVHVAGGNVQPRRTESRPQLPPAQPVEVILPVYSKSEDRAPTGQILPVSAPLVSGGGYQLAYAGAVSGNPTIGALPSVTATFDATSLLTGFFEPSLPITATATAVAGGFTMDGVIGWGMWTTGSQTVSVITSPLKEFHYVAGIPTSTADLAGLNLSATYQLAGYTTPTTSTGLVAGAPSVLMNATFSAAAISLTINIAVPVAGVTYSDTFTGTTTTADFTLNTASNSVNGFFAGANASHAGLTYKLDTTGPAGFITGAAVLKR